jgi:hypothetical protein
VKFSAHIKMDNAAFDDPEELARVLRRIADEVTTGVGRQSVGDYPVRDINGNSVGTWSISGKRPL